MRWLATICVASAVELQLYESGGQARRQRQVGFRNRSDLRDVDCMPKRGSVDNPSISGFTGKALP